MQQVFLPGGNQTHVMAESWVFQRIIHKTAVSVGFHNFSENFKDIPNIK